MLSERSIEFTTRSRAPAERIGGLESLVTAWSATVRCCSTDKDDDETTNKVEGGALQL